MSSKEKPTVAITGATGFLGSALVQHFSKQGWKVVGLVRTPPKDKRSGVTYKKYDLATTPDKKLLQGVDYVIHAAYVKVSRQNPDAFAINTNAAKQLLDVCRVTNVKKPLFISTMSAHERATSVYGKQKLAIEKLFTNSGGICLRSGLILGNGGIVADMASFMRSKHLVPVIGGGKQPLQTIAVYDLCRVIEAALKNNKIEGILTVATPKVYTYKEFYTELAKSIGVKVLFIPVPYYALLGAFKLASLLRLPLDVGEDNLKGLQQLRSARTKDDLRTLGTNIDDLPTALAKIKQ